MDLRKTVMRMLTRQWPGVTTAQELAAKASRDERRLAELRRRAQALGVGVDSVRRQ